MESSRPVYCDDNLPKPKHERRDLIFKFLVIGEYGVGKTAIVRRYTEGKFSSNYKTTVGAEFGSKILMWDARTRVRVHLWDIAGHERFYCMTRTYYQHAIGCAVVFDITRCSSFKAVTRWVTGLHNRVVQEDGNPIPVILLANKWDISEVCVSDEEINKLCAELEIKTWFKTSAKNDVNIDEGINKLVEESIKLIKPETNVPEISSSDRIVLDAPVQHKPIPTRDRCCN